MCLGLLVVMGMPGCASYDAWARQKIYKPVQTTDAAEWQRLLSLRPDVQARSVPAGEPGQQIQLLSQRAKVGVTSSVRVLYLHGTFRNAYQNLPKTEAMLASGLDVVLLDYRGWGASAPLLPNEAGILADTFTAWDALQAESASGATPARWVIYGHSMGTAAAVALAQRVRGQGHTCALVLESGFTSFLDVAQAAAGWPGWLLARMGHERMASLDRMADVDAPVWFVHGTNDRTIPLRVGRALFERAPEPKHWVELPLGHSNLHTDTSGLYAQTWRQIAAQCASAPVTVERSLP